MKCKTVHKKLFLYIDNETTDSENVKINNHLQSCENCKQLYYDLKTTLNIINEQETLKPNPFLYTRIKQKLDVIEDKRKQNIFVPVYKKILQPVLLSFLLIVGFFFGIKIGNTYETKKYEDISLKTELYFDDFQQEEIEILLLNE